jgi:hypothetical protein
MTITFDPQVVHDQFPSQSPDIFLERFTVASWSEFERQRTEPWLDYDSEGVTRAIGYTVDNARRHQYYLATRVPR